MKYNQRDIIDVAFDLPDGSIKIHPALIISALNYYESEDAYYAVMISSKNYNEEFSVELVPGEISIPLPKTSFVKCQLIESFSDSDVIKRRGRVSKTLFDLIKSKVIEALFK